MLWKRVLLVSTVCVGVLALALGCAPAPTPIAEVPTVTPTTPPAPTPTSPPAPTPAEKISLVVYYWGAQDAPALEDWWAVVESAYEELHPNIDLQIVLQGTDEVIPAFKAAVEAGTGPDLATLWYGLYFMEDVWAGNVEPLNDYISEEELSHWTAAPLHTWDGKLWAADFYPDLETIVYNKQMFAQAGLDPEDPPDTWEEFLAAGDALKAAGITPIYIGVKDGWYACIWATDMRQDWTVEDLKAAVAGEARFDEPPMVMFWERIYELKERGFFNDDASSLTGFEGRTGFEAEKGAMNFLTWTTVKHVIEEMGTGTVGFMPPPRTTIPQSFTYDVETLFIPKFAAHKQEAADFLTFIHSPEMLNALYEIVGSFPADDRFDPSIITDPVDREVYEYLARAIEGQNRWAESLIPWMIFEEGYFPALQLMFAEDLKPEEAAKMVQDAAERWRELSPEMLEAYKGW